METVETRWRRKRAEKYGPWREEESAHASYGCAHINKVHTSRLSLEWRTWAIEARREGSKGTVMGRTVAVTVSEFKYERILLGI